MKYQFNGFTKGANNALCFAIETAEEMGHTYVGSEHLLVGLLKEQEGAAASLLAARNVTAEQVADGRHQRLKTAEIQTDDQHMLRL